MNTTIDLQHVSVLKEEVDKFLDLSDLVVDATLGLGGHSLDILKKIGKSGVLYAFDQDERNLEEAKTRLKEYEKQIVYLKDNFRYLKTRICEASASEQSIVTAILFDLGLASTHVDTADRGFSFNLDGPLDMRFDPNSDLTAAQILNTYDEDALADIFFKYGEEPMSRRVARRICEERKTAPFDSTVRFREFLEEILPKKRTQKSHPATKIFQALRIEVNDELNALKEALAQAFEILKVGGRIVVISYHSLEDRIVKQFFKELLQPPGDGIYSNHGEPQVEALTKKPVTPSEREISSNPRSRSAKLRAYRKLKIH
ncbi:MAG: 16S rRNA (cytosine(1402)-N(4))-methyltransferase RsmH [bacterium]|nr:16S rRNA (cytosine(1402)-N(4))-methyltransferase RsmH [bacterium]